MRTPVIAGNWKMNTTIFEAKQLVSEMRTELELLNNTEIIICPPFISLPAINELLEDSSIKTGAQNMCFAIKGAYTGEISPLMLHGLCEYVILGHSERRIYFAETDEIINSKIQNATKHNLKPIICVGESLTEKEAGKTEKILSKQLEKGLREIVQTRDLLIAYEPLWAIGTGMAANGEEANVTIKFIREKMAQIWSNSIAEDLRILYGGSVKADNIIEFISQTDIDGVLVGGASLKAQEFTSIASQIADYRK